MQILFSDVGPSGQGATAILVAKRGKAAEVHARGGQVGRALAAARFDGEVGAIVELLAPTEVAATRVLAVGYGDPDKADQGILERVGAALAAHLMMSGETELTIDMAGLERSGAALASAAARVAYGALLRAYRFDKYRTKMPESQQPTLRRICVANAPAGAQEAFGQLAPVADGVYFTRDLVSEPANMLYPESFAERALALAELGVKVDVLTEQDMAKLGMGALLGVAQGSARPARLLVLEWNGTGRTSSRPVVFIGKGVTFDSGGISIKAPPGMEDMKWDMAGAGAVAGAIKALAGRKAKAHVVGICGLVENMPSGGALRPSDVVTSMSGQTIEVINTDAEGRMVLCDAITYAQTNFQPEAIVDLATLTGVMILALGREYGGMFANDDTLAAQLVAAGKVTGDRLWRFPLDEVYDRLIDSQIADMKNFEKSEAGAIAAAQFLQRFVDEGVKWAHLDIGGLVWALKPGALWDKGATGFGVRLIDQFVAENYEA